MADEVFDEEFFKKLGKLWEDFIVFVNTYWVFALILGIILVIVALFQQVILSFF